MSTPAPAADPCAAAAPLVASLRALLEDEYATLQARDTARLEQLQPGKLELLQRLQACADAVAALPQAPAAWEPVRAAIDGCRDQFLRNQVLLARQLEVVQGALRALQSAADPAQSDLYDTLGAAARRRRARDWLNA